jgi:hypothetical protein
VTNYILFSLNATIAGLSLIGIVAVRARRRRCPSSSRLFLPASDHRRSTDDRLRSAAAQSFRKAYHWLRGYSFLQVLAYAAARHPSLLSRVVDGGGVVF